MLYLTLIRLPLKRKMMSILNNIKLIDMKIIINESQIKKMVNKLKWEEVSGKLIRTYYFKDYKEVMPFVDSVMKIADKQNHHPDMTVHYDSVKLSITDHDAGKVSDKCHKFTDAVDKIKNN